MNIQMDWKVVEAFEDALVKARRNTTCLYPGCDDVPICSHVIAQKSLKLIAEKGKVLTWNLPTVWDMYRQQKAGKSLEDVSLEPKSVGIHDTRKVTHPIFCRDHDNRIFTPLEKHEIASCADLFPEQIVLLAYRALSSVTYNNTVTEAIFEVIKQHGYKNSLSEPEKYARLRRFQSRDILLKAHQRYEQIHLTHDYQQLSWSMYPVNLQPCIAATYSLIPVDDNDAHSIVDGKLLLAAEDVINFTLLPDPRNGKSICVLSWLKGSPRAKRFLVLNRLNELSEQERQNVIFSFAFESPTIYISPIWWCSLTQEKREEYARIHLNAGREHAKLV